MKYQINTSILINAAPEVVWNNFFNFRTYPEWNPFIKYIKGNIEQGQKFRVQLNSIEFKPRLITLKKEREFTWLGHLFIPGIFDGCHSFQFIDNGDGTTTLIQKEDFNGILVRLMKKKLDTEIMTGFKAMNEALKNRVESQNGLNQLDKNARSGV